MNFIKLIDIFGMAVIIASLLFMLFTLAVLSVQAIPNF